jgi:signal transduction histidine kinase/CheY-like chemotaxis protein
MMNLQVSTPIGVHENLDDLRQTIVRYLLTSIILLGIFEAWTTLRSEPFQSERFLLWLSLALVGILTMAFLGRFPLVARQLLVWGSLAWSLAAIWFFPSPWVPFFSLLGILASGLLIPASDLVYAIATFVFTGALVWAGQRSYPLADLLLAACLGLFVSFILRRTLLTALAWAWSSQQRSVQLLGEARKHRAEVSRALKSLEIAHSIQSKIQDELLVARRQADEARQMKERFAANISHELRTPLNLILGFSEVMYKSPETYGSVSWTPTLRRDIYQIYRSSEHLLSMIDDILDLSRYQMLDFSLAKESVPVGKPILEAVEIVRDLFVGAPVALETDLAPDSPVLNIDVTRIRQVVINLLKNARSFTSEGSVRVTARTEEDHVLISVKDTGEGIPQEKLSAIFDEFYQVDQSRSRKRQGAGLGLAICKRLIEAHQGRIWVESQEGAGTEFFFTLPLPAHKYDTQPALIPPLYDHLQPTGRNCLLVVESDPAIVSMIARRIGDLETIQVADASLLDEYVARYRPRAVIVNVFPGNSPPLKLKADYPVPVIQASLPSREWLARELAIGASLIKPVTSRQLSECLARYEQAKEILIVDDDREFVQLMNRYLQSSGKKYKVRFAYDGDEGWQSLCRQPPDVVLLDVIMPGRSGFDIVEEMKHNEALSKTEVILITGTHFDKDIADKYENQMHIQRAGGLTYAQMLACLEALVDVFKDEIVEGR